MICCILCKKWDSLFMLLCCYSMVANGLKPVVQVNGMGSSPFHMEPQLRHCCLLSPFLFNLIMFGFHVCVRQCCKGHDINLTPLHVVYSLLYDSLCLMLDVVNKYCLAHNMHIRLDKSSVLSVAMTATQHSRLHIVWGKTVSLLKEALSTCHQG